MDRYEPPYEVQTRFARGVAANVARPALTSYTRLHAVLKNDHAANAQFNAYLNELSNRLNMHGEDATAADLEKSQLNLAETLKKYNELLTVSSKTRRLITLLGETIEPQVNLRPYTQDLEEKNTYTITFNARQLRLALSMYWDLLTREAEDKLLGCMDDEELTDSED